MAKVPVKDINGEREHANINIADTVKKGSVRWGIACLRFEIRNISIPERIQEAMQKKQASILESEGEPQGIINHLQKNHLRRALR